MDAFGAEIARPRVAYARAGVLVIAAATTQAEAGDSL
jgi:hypothetical protein